ncbi:hypothetical protein K7X08_022133 [Anisodus acutangulus]|uniref:Uncharacterized protein n=1 Tax=Anisodus acutangulus TaxID=402998 RepID=A0A9Q1L472_9SOLA|nr:hypothetical protein K7X08_022133 [Anisodus acutangulus]
MNPNNQNADKRVVKNLKNVFGFERNESLLSNDGGDDEASDASFNGGPDPYLDSEDEELNMLALAEIEEEINTQDQWEENNELNMPDQGSDQEEYEDQKVEDDEDGMNEETFTHEEFLQGPTEGMLFKSKESLFVFYKENDTLKGFGIAKRTSNKKGADYIREDDMVVPNVVGVDESNEDDATFIRNLREVLPQRRLPINRYRGGRGNNFRRGG